MPVIEISTLDDERLAPFFNLTDNQLEKYGDRGIFIAESPKVINTAIDAGYIPISMLCERKHILGDASGIILAHPDMEVFTGSRELLASITGYKLTRGVLCAMRRKPPMEASVICKGSRVAVIEAVCDTTNIGSIFRSAAALGIDGILLTPDSCDPLNRRAIRVSMGSVFKVPWAIEENPVDLLKKNNFTTVALTLHKDSLNIDDPILASREKIALVLGTEGDGLSKEIIARCDYKAIIPMQKGVDSLNVGAAAAVAFWQFRSNNKK